MTYEKARKYLYIRRRGMIQNRDLYNETEIAVNRKALEAVEKQINKKPKISKEKTTDNFSRYKCPICNNFVSNFYCAFCGQRLDWTEFAGEI